MNLKSGIMDKLRCLDCYCPLIDSGVNMTCNKCGKIYSISSDKLIFNNYDSNLDFGKQDGLIYKLKFFFKKFPTIFYLLACIFGAPPINKSVIKFINSLGVSDKTIINIGSGSKIINKKVINIDCYPYEGVSIVALAENLPFNNNSIDIIICDYILEHVKDPKMIVDEIYRVLKAGGLVYVGLPFIIGYHSAPGDYFRWTKNGVQELLNRFEEIELKPAYGPTSAMTNILGEWLSILLSFNIGLLHQIWSIFFMIILSPLKFIDFLIGNYKSSENITYGFYFIGKKK